MSGIGPQPGASQVVGGSTLPASPTVRQIFVVPGTGMFVCLTAGSWTLLDAGPDTGNVSGSGTTNRLTKWIDGAGGVIGDSALLDNGVTVTSIRGLVAPSFTSAAANPADAGAVRLGNTELIAWEAATPGTDLTLSVNASNQLVFSGSIGAQTWGGTVSGGGQQLNNVIIGTSTPLAGSFTTLQTSGDVTLSNNGNATKVWTFQNTDNTSAASRAQILLTAGGVQAKFQSLATDAVYIGSSTDNDFHLQRNANNVIDFMSGGRVVLNAGATTSGVADLDINPTTKASGNLISARVNSVSKFSADFAGAVTQAGKTTTYNNIATAGMGLPAIYQAPAQSATQTANFTVFDHTPPAVAGTYRVSGVITTTSATNTGTVQFTLDYVDSQGTTHTADIIPLQDAAGTWATTKSGASKEFYGAVKTFTINNAASHILLKVVITGAVSYTVTGSLEQIN